MTDAGDGVAVVIVTHDSGATLARCLEAVLDADAVVEIVIVDNGSVDGSVDSLSQRLDVRGARVRVLRNAGNPGFAVACNQGAATCSASYLTFLNPDCFVERQTLTRLRDLLAAQPGIGLIAPAVCDANGVPEPAARRRDPTLTRMLVQALHLPAALGFEGMHAAAADSTTEFAAVDATSGALMLLPRAPYLQLGGFDPAYRLHAEDLDLCRRVRGSGRIVAVAGAVRVVHLKGTSSRRNPLFVAWHKHRGLARYLRKFGAGAAAWMTPVAIAGVWMMFAIKLPLIVAREIRARVAPM